MDAPRAAPPAVAAATVVRVPTLPEPKTAAPAPPVAAPLPTEHDLDESEVVLREAFHRLDADRTDMPRIWRADGHVYFEVFAQSPEREREILQAAGAVPYVLRGTMPRPASAPAPPGDVRLHTTQPPLAESLWKYFGGLDLANAYLRQVRDAYLKLLVDSAALSRLAERYPDRDWQGLSEESRRIVDAIAADYVRGAQSGAREYLGLISPVVDEMMRDQGVAAPVADGTPARRDCAWARRRTGVSPAISEVAIVVPKAVPGGTDRPTCRTLRAASARGSCGSSRVFAGRIDPAMPAVKALSELGNSNGIT